MSRTKMTLRLGPAAITALVALCALLSATAVSAQGNTRTKLGLLPGLSHLPSFNQWTGYVNVRPSSGRHLFYWFVESQRNPAHDPVVLWLTGGPGCSSIFALLTENGPFRVEDDAFTLRKHLQSWNTVANIIYVESPSGVGFSYADDGNYTTGDNDAAEDNFQFVLGFFKLFPEFVRNPFFVAGESYAGHYVPQLAEKLFERPEGKAVNLQGFMAGNPSTDWTIEPDAYWAFMAYHALMSTSDWKEAQHVCRNNFTHPTSACTTTLDRIRSAFNRVNPYNIYAPCIGPSDPAGGCLTQQMALAFAARPERSQRSSSSDLYSVGSQTFIPCINVSAPQQYMQRPDVQRALGVSPKSQKFEWTACSAHLNYTQYAISVLPIYAKLWRSMRVLVYSGDVDSCVPYLGTEACMDALGLPVVEPWRAWIVDGQVAGYVKVLGGRAGGPSLTYATVKEAGHMVPTYKPDEALALFLSFINGARL